MTDSISSRKDIHRRTYLVYFVMFMASATVLIRISYIQLAEGAAWKERANSQTTAYRDIEAVRGNIYTREGSLLATSIPIFEIRMDPNTEALTDDVFYAHIDSLAYCLSKLEVGKSRAQWKQELTKARNSGERFHLIKRKVRYRELKQIRQFPIFRLGKYKGGLIVLQQNKRERPFRMLAARTIGYERPNAKPVGLEGAYSKELSGVSGRQLMKKIAGGVWMPMEDENGIEPEDGSDVITTININFQDVAEHALLEKVKSNNADHGCAILMEVSTGEILAMANLSRDGDNDYYEYYNYAIGESTEPGSTFKLASLVAALDDGMLKLTDSVDTEDGKTKYYDAVMSDSHKGGYGRISVKRAFEVSSNVGISKLIYRSYWKHPQQFIDRLYSMHLNEPTGIEISGEGLPEIKSTSDKSWSGVTLPWMSIGYEVRLTPLQILTFYNAIANGGRMVRPRFVKEIR
ncbi:MAG: peptidoglycan D,D-transpeptidase FtsI family protein, partial [Flavobacteriales bacterium]